MGLKRTVISLTRNYWLTTKTALLHDWFLDMRLSSKRIKLLVASSIFVSACSSEQGRSDAEMAATVSEMARTNVMFEEATAASPVASPGTLSAETLRDVVSGNDRFIAAIARYQEAQAGVGIAESGRRPQLTAGLTAGGFVEDSDSGIGTAANVNLVQLISDGGQTAAQIDAASARAFAARAGITVTGNEVVRDAANAWVDVWLYNSRLSLLRSQVSELQPSIALLNQLSASGVINRSTLNSVERQVLDIELEEESVSASLRAAQEQFRKFFGFDPGNVGTPPVLLSENDVFALRTAWQDAPALVAAAAELLAAESDLEATDAAQRPRISLSTGLSSPLSESDGELITLGVTVDYNVFDGGRQSSQVEARDARLRSLRGDFEDTKSSGQADLEAGIARYRSARSSTSLLDEQIEVIRAEAASLESQLSTGQSDIQQFIEAEIRLYQAQVRRLELIAGQRRLEVQLGSQTGRLLQRLEVDVDGRL